MSGSKLATNSDEVKAVVTDEATVGRRVALRRLSALAVGAVAVGTVLKPDAAGATVGVMQFGVNNDSGANGTFLQNTSGDLTFLVENNGSGNALQAASNGPTAMGVASGPGNGDCMRITSGSDGAGLSVTRNNSAIAGAAIDATSDNSGPVYRATSQPQCGEPLYVGTHNGFGAGMQLTLTSTTSAEHVIDATQAGTGPAIAASVENTTSHANCVRATTTGTGSALYGGGGSHGRGATLVSNVAQLRLEPGSLSSHPTSGAPGDLYVDKTARLWFCKSGTSWHQLA